MNRIGVDVGLASAARVLDDLLDRDPSIRSIRFIGGSHGVGAVLKAYEP